MNENLLAQLNQQRPAITPFSGQKIADLDIIYHVCLTINPRFGELEVDDNVSASDVYDIMVSFLERTGISVEWIPTSVGVKLHFEYTFPFDTGFVDISNLLQVKENDSVAYNALLRCITLISQYSYNSLDLYEMCAEYFDEQLIPENCEPEEAEEYEESYNLLKSIESLVTDYNSIDYESALKTLAGIPEDAPHYGSLSKLCEFVSCHYPSWRVFNAIYNQNDTPDYYQSDILFTRYVGFKLFPYNTYINGYWEGDLQSHYEESWIADSVCFEDDDVRKLNSLKKSYFTLVRSIVMVGDLITEVQHA